MIYKCFYPAELFGLTTEKLRLTFEAYTLSAIY